MAKTPNIQIKGNFKVGKSAVDNTMPIYRPTGDPVTLRQLLDRPSYYLSKIGQHFGLSYDKSELTKEAFWEPYSGAKGVVNPSMGAGINIEKYIEQKAPPQLDVKVINDGDLGVITQASYNLRYEDPIHGVKISRPLKYYFTCEELQHVIDNDLISGVSGFNVSSAGNQYWPEFGPYFIQNNETGDFNQTLSVINQTELSRISGYVDNAYNGSAIERGIRYLKFFKTGQVDNQVYEVKVSYLPESFINGESYQDYYITANSNVVSSANGTVLNSWRNPPYDFGLEYYISGKSDLNENNEYVRLITGNYGTGMIGSYTQFNLYKRYQDFRVFFDDVVDGTDMDKSLHIVNASGQWVNTEIATEGGIIPSLGYLDFNTNNYSETDHWYLGAPYVFHSHPYFTYSSVRVHNSNDIEAFRIPQQNNKTSRFLRKIEFTDNPNLTYVNIPAGLPLLEHINFSGCNVSNFNLAHQNHINQSASGEAPFNMYSYYESGRHQMQEFEGESKDTFGVEALNPLGMSATGLKYVNFHGNNLNQTGINFIIASLNPSQRNGYIDISNQSPRNGPEAAVFDGFRENPYTEHKDYNNQIVSGIIILKQGGWTVKYDGSIPGYPSS